MCRIKRTIHQPLHSLGSNSDILSFRNESWACKIISAGIGVALHYLEKKINKEELEGDKGVMRNDHFAASAAEDAIIPMAH